MYSWCDSEPDKLKERYGRVAMSENQLLSSGLIKLQGLAWVESKGGARIVC
jgi:hypothetical protein